MICYCIVSRGCIGQYFGSARFTIVNHCSNMKTTTLFLAVLCLASISESAAPADERRQPDSPFTHGVASGDPDQESVLLWTRLVPRDRATAKVTWEVSRDDRFTTVVASGAAAAAAENDFCVKVVAGGLEAATTYYYRFRCGQLDSGIGRTRTLPRETDHVRIGVANCGKYTGGYYHAYDALAKTDDLDVVIHLGDYIYENGPAKPGSSYYPAFLATGRQHDPPHDCVTLEDYRTRYAQYRGDPDLLRLHARHAMIAIWDDHEIAAIPKKKLPGGLPDYSSNWEEQFRNSLKAWHEWIPTRVKLNDVIYRSYQFGDLVNLLMLDTRVCGKSTVTQTEESLRDPNRHIVGDEQLQWMFDEVTQHDAAWNVIGNQLLMAEKDKGWNRWPGFPADRNRLLKFVEERQPLNVLVTTGNAHNPHHYIVRDRAQRRTLFHEVLPGSVSSGNNAEKARFDAAELKKIAARLDSMDNVLWYHSNSHGYIIIDITSERAQVDWYFVSDIRQPEYEISQPYSTTIPSLRDSDVSSR